MSDYRYILAHRKPPATRCRASGKVLVLVVLLLPALLGIVGLVFDAGLMSASYRNGQHAADAAANAAAMELLLGKNDELTEATAIEYVQQFNQLAAANVTIHIPPATGPYAGRSGFVEAIVEQDYNTRFIHLLGGSTVQTSSARAVAGHKAATAGAAVVILDPDPAPLSIPPLPGILPALPSLLGGLEVLGIGGMNVDGAVLVNTNWGGVDQDGNPAGETEGPPWAVSCMPLLPLTKLLAHDIRVSGGVDNEINYGHFTEGEASPLEANRLPVPDPFVALPVPTLVSDSTNVSDTYHGGVQVVSLPIIFPPTVLSPGVYDWIEVLSGQVTFEPGVYVIRSVNPSTQIGLNISAGTVTANGVLFYITNSADYDVSSGEPDASDGETAPAVPEVVSLVPSVVINTALLGSSYSPLSDPSSPFNGMLVYQRRQDRRPIVIAHTSLLGSSIAGTIYAKWAHSIFVGQGDYDMRFVVGTARFVSVLGINLVPSELLPPARDVFLVE